jgi:hypothetical protein
VVNGEIGKRNRFFEMKRMLRDGWQGEFRKQKDEKRKVVRKETRMTGRRMNYDIEARKTEHVVPGIVY